MAVFTVINTLVGQQYFKQGNTSAVTAEAVTDTCRHTVSHACTVSFPLHTAGGTGHIIFGSIGQDAQFIHQRHFISRCKMLHVFLLSQNICSISKVAHMFLFCK